jgi:hypothetical protein
VKPKGELKFKGGKIVDVPASTAGKDFAFEVKDKSGKESIVFACANQDHFNNWTA